MRIGLIDIDGHRYPNLALMKLSAWHKSQGDAVDWWSGFEHYDVVYMSKVFSGAYSGDELAPCNADKIIRGGSGYAITTVSGLEIYDPTLDPPLPPEIEHICPDYGSYPELTKDTAYGRLTVGCPKKCPWCHVGAMQGTTARHVADLPEFWRGQKNIEILDPNILACPERERLLEQLAGSKAWINFSQGLDIQRMDGDVIALLNRCKIRRYHFAWDDPAVDLADQYLDLAMILPMFGASKKELMP